MNKNIEVINNRLWAVKFSFLQFISEIDYKPDSKMVYEEPAHIVNDGILLLNKDCPGFEILKDYFPRIMIKKDKQLKKELTNAKHIKNKTHWDNLYHGMIQVEAERREKERKVKLCGYNKNYTSIM
ncbi:MAG: hypothetical protein FNP40_13940 [Dehalobacter sp. 4CP]|uniref:hypothetical protein n=1 Tax=Dehalobacter sp. CP TaxID=2594474 RepID=UPI0013CA0B51|nr:hypothetical protein [Dehalobacter sp. 4CP]